MTYVHARDSVMTADESEEVFTKLPTKIEGAKEELRKSINIYLRSLQSGEI